MNRRLSLSLLLSGLLTIGLCLLTTGVVAQQEDESGGKKSAATKPGTQKGEDASDPKKPPAKPAKPAEQKGEDESDPKKPPAKPTQPNKGEDESDPKKPAPKSGDTPKPAVTPTPAEPDPMAKPAVQPPSEGPFKLEEEAGRAAHPALKKLLQDFAKPHDVVAATTGQNFDIEPLPKRYDPNKMATLTFTPVGSVAKTLPNDTIKEVRYYELMALQDVRKLMTSGLDAKPAGAGKPAVARVDLLRTAEMVLWKARDFYATAKKEGKRLTEPWTTAEQDLNKEILNTRIGEIRAYAESEKDGFDIADALGGALFAKYPGSADLLDALEKLYTGQAHAAVREGHYPHARDVLDALDRKYHINKTQEVAAIRKQLMDKSRELYHSGVAKEEKNDSSGALQLYTEAVRIAPENRDAKDRIPPLLRKVAIMRVGVRKLPEQMSPTTAVTDVDRMATHLIFENLFHLRAGPSAREGYVCDLGADVRITNKGIDVYLPDIKWSDGEPVTAKDIERSYDILVDPRSPYYDVTAKELLRLQVADPQHFTLTLQRSYLDPAALMCFPVIPADKLPKERDPRNQAFGKKPVGSGPYVFKGYEQTNDGDEAVFVANQHYRRPDAPEGPFIKEIRFIKYSDFGVAKEALSQGRWQMLLDLTTRETAELSGINRVAVLTPTEADKLNSPYLNNPRVYFLALNHRKAPLQNVNLRKAIAAAIDREAILNSFYRGGGKVFHTPIAGPFPLGSWAYSDTKEYAIEPGKDPLYNAANAKRMAEAGGRPSLRFRFPLDDPQIVPACNKIKQMLGEAGLQINIQPSKREDMIADFGKEQPDFDIAFWYYDFDNETLSLRPLLDPEGLGARGRNYMGFERDNQLQGFLRELLSHREFAATQRTMQAIHDAVMDRMVFVPLWQIDRHVAVHRSLQFRRLHPLQVFDEVEQWKLFIVEGN
jgi:ABC-type transport system substrate-binding protein/outer membrane biosynthesis protein TonB